MIPKKLFFRIYVHFSLALNFYKMLNFTQRKENFTMKRLALFIGGLLVLPAFAEVAPIFYTENDAMEYADAMYDENGFLIISDEEIVDADTDVVTQKTPIKASRAPVNSTPVGTRTTASRAIPTSGTSATSGRGSANGNSSRAVAARTTTNASPRSTASRTVASRGTSATSPRTTATTTSTRTTANTAATRAAATRATGGSSRASANGASVARTGTVAGRTATAGRTTAARTTKTSAGVARATTTGAGRISVNSERVNPGAKVGTTTLVAGVSANADGTTTLYNANNRSGSTSRMPTIRMASLNSGSTDEVSIAATTAEMDDLAELTDYCKAQYASCMDNYCNVLDDNQGRCSCSGNLKSYAKTEAALKSATEELQEVAQKIQYIGLTTREVETLFTETAAEETMRRNGTTDNSVLKTSLDKVKNMIIDVKSGGTTSSTDAGLNFDLSGLLEFSFDSTGFDLASLFGTSSAGSVSNQRGEELYKTAAARCKTSVLKACTARGVDASLITNAYDLEIDRECMAYERSLNDSNDEMLATVRNAKSVLQKARLMVAQQKNAYDMRGCINALDACMQDEFVCGSDYENCLDPTGRYIVNGEIVVGSQPGHAIDPELSNNVASVMTSDVCRVNLYRTWNFLKDNGDVEQCVAHTGNSNGPTYESYPSTYDQNNAWGSGTGDTLVAYIENTVTGIPDKTSENMSRYLQNKIGYNKDNRNFGMCMSVLNKCQDYTYTNSNETYNPKNEVIKQYLGRILVQIKAKQDEILANYAETCVSDVTTCLNQNGYPYDVEPGDWSSAETVKANIAVNACRAQVVTCMSVNGYSIETPTPTEMNCWVQGLLFSSSSTECLRDNTGDTGCSLSNLPACNYSQCNELATSTSNLVTWCTTGTKNECKYTSECTTPQPTEYTVKINCGNFSTYQGHFDPRAAIAPSGSCGYEQCGTITTGNGCITLSEDGICSMPQNDKAKLSGWTCGGQTVAVGDPFCPAVDNITCTATWQSRGGSQTNPDWLIVNLNNGSQSGATSASPNTLYVDKNGVCSGVYDTTVTTNTGCPATSLTSITVPSVSGGTTVFKRFEYEGLQYIASNGLIDETLFAGLAGSTTASSVTLTAQWGPQTEYTYIAFYPTNGTWQTLSSTPSASEYDLYTDFDIAFYPAKVVCSESGDMCTNVGSPSRVHYNTSTGYSMQSLAASSKDGWTLRGYYPKQLPVTALSDATGKAWPRGNLGSTISNMPTDWVLALPAGTNFTDRILKLYAAYAKNCPTSVSNGYCSMSIGTTGAVVYNAGCDSGYTQVGSGADITCQSGVTPDDADWREIIIPD